MGEILQQDHLHEILTTSLIARHTKRLREIVSRLHNEARDGCSKFDARKLWGGGRQKPDHDRDTWLVAELEHLGYIIPEPWTTEQAWVYIVEPGDLGILTELCRVCATTEVSANKRRKVDENDE